VADIVPAVAAVVRATAGKDSIAEYESAASHGPRLMNHPAARCRSVAFCREHLLALGILVQSAVAEQQMIH